MSANLRDFIKSVRACKTAAEEREVVARESAALRSAFKDDTANYRHRNIAKLMFIHMLGYPTHFGQMECLKLIASVGFPEKRMGYLGLMLLLDEKQEVLMLATNSIKNDFHNSNQFIAGLALSAFANICSAEMASDLAAEIQTLFQHTNPYIRKKAALCCVRIVRKVPDLMESLINPAASLLSDKHHGVLITGVKLCTVLCQSNPIALEHFTKQTSSLVGLLRNVVNSGYTAEYDVSGVPDPFLQIELLRLLRIVGKGDPDSSDIMTDILAQVATNTDCSKIPGSAILYECVQTIMNIECTVGLRVLAVNILGRFLPNKDNNIRYVALNMLAKVVGMDTQAVQRHRLVIVECVRDSDVSIRRRALELVCALVNENNVQTLTTELLEYLKVCDSEFKADLTIKICSLVQKLAPSKVWYAERMVELMLQAGRFITNDIVHTALVIISNASEIHGYIVKLLYHAFQQWSGQECLALVTIWCIGEYGEFLLNHQGEDDLAITESDAVDFLERLLNDSRSSPVVKAFALTALLKLSSRYVSFTEKIKELISKYKDSVVAELQQRAVEYSRILEKNENLRIHVTRKMPVLDEASYQTKRLDDALHSGGIISNASPPSTEKGATALNEDKHSSVKSLANLLDITNEEPSSQVQKQAGDILQDLLGFCSDTVSNNVQDQGPTYASIVAFESSGLKITFDFMKPTDNLQTTVINATCVNTSSNSYTNFSLQAAVPKFLLLSLDSASGTVVPPGDKLIQVLTITNSMHGQKPLIMRLKISYTMLGQEIVDQCQIDRFPAGL